MSLKNIYSSSGTIFSQYTPPGFDSLVRNWFLMRCERLAGSTHVNQLQQICPFLSHFLSNMPPTFIIKLFYACWSLLLREDGYNVYKSSVECLFPVHPGKTTQPRPMGQVNKVTHIAFSANAPGQTSRTTETKTHSGHYQWKQNEYRLS